MARPSEQPRAAATGHVSAPPTEGRTGTGRTVSPRLLLWLASIVLLLFLLVPLAAIFVRALPDDQLGASLRDPIVEEALRLSLITTFITLFASVLLGTPVAYLLARYEFRGRGVIDTLVDLPMVLPPAVAGVALLMAFGRRGLLGEPVYEVFGWSIPFTTLAVVMAQTFVAAPFYVRSARAGFETVSPELEAVATTLGASRARVFWTITVPLALPALLGGAVMTWARALGEFGATIMFAGNFIGRTQTMPLAIYQSMESGRLTDALVLSGILIIASFAVLLLFRVLVRRAVPSGFDDHA